MLGNGFILTAVLWGAALAFIIDRRFGPAAVVFGAASLAAVFGVIHSPLASGGLFWPWDATAPMGIALRLAGTYGVLAACCWIAARRPRDRGC